jgi:hypothetical protein
MAATLDATTDIPTPSEARKPFVHKGFGSRDPIVISRRHYDRRMPDWLDELVFPAPWRDLRGPGTQILEAAAALEAAMELRHPSEDHD